MRASGRRMRADAEMIKTRALNSLVIVMRNPNKYSEIGASFEIEHKPGVFDRLPGGLEEEPVLRIDVGSFPRRDTKKLRIELIDRVNKPAAHGDGFTGDTWFGVVISLHVPPVGRHLDHTFPAFDEKFPERFGVVYTAGKPATDSNDRNTFLLHNLKQPRVAN